MITKVARDRSLALACAAVLCCILAAGLWPFTPHPRNQVAWLVNGNGLHFGHHGTIVSSGAFKPAESASGVPCSLEVWAQPGPLNKSGTLLGFYSPQMPLSFSIYQYRNGLVFERRRLDRQWHEGAPGSTVDNVFHPGLPAFLAVTADAQGTATYVDGVVVDRSPRLRIANGDFRGQMVIANSPLADDSWSGDFRGLAIYDRVLTATEVLEHLNSWTKYGRPAISEKGDPIALYLFDERAGSVIHNRAGLAPDLYTPDHYLILRQPFLQAPWEEFYPHWSYFEDVSVNIGGFIPFGIVFCAYFSSARNLKRARLMTILLGFTVSLTIEILQAYIPSRDSGMTDVITNTLGSAIGAMAFQWKITHAIFSRVGIPVEH